MRADPRRPGNEPGWSRLGWRSGAGRRYAHDHPRRTNLLVLAGGGLFMAAGYLAPRLRLNPDELNTPDFPDVGATVLALGTAVTVDLLLLAAFALHDRTLRTRAGGTDDPAALVPPLLRPFCWLVIVPSLAGAAVLASRVSDSRGPLGVDRRVDDPLAHRLRPLRPVFEGLTQLGSPAGVAAPRCSRWPAHRWPAC